VQNNGRALIEFSVGKDARIFSLRLTGAVLHTVELYGVEIDFYFPGSDPSPGRG
jgi:hypothetical protein